MNKTPEHREIIETNRRRWNATAEVHAEAYVRRLCEEITEPGFTTFDDVERRIFKRIGLDGKDVIQLACNNGRELISVKKAGAGRCVGIDISDPFIAQAEQLAAAASVDVTFVRSDVFDTPTEFDGGFDLVYITIGVLGWLPELDAFFGIVNRLLKPGGRMFIYEMHPLLNMFEPDSATEVVESYFRRSPFFTESEPDYCNPHRTIDAPSYWFSHTMTDILGGSLANGLRLTHFEEFPHDISNLFASFEEQTYQLPLCFTMIAEKSK